ncbi:5-formyltetrahydrofolate cyclo-ligase [Treponema sp.]|uniref:5-formyltetrahydrofolate cyclo-ligase n=1 Tax=Treponema sp. TaxID=166 RepID=UPI003F047970
MKKVYPLFGHFTIRKQGFNSALRGKLDFCSRTGYYHFMTKDELRKQMKILTGNVDSVFKNEASQKACGFFLEFEKTTGFDVLLSYVDMKNEISAGGITFEFMRRNKIVAVPRTVPGTQDMNFFILDNNSEFSAQLEKGAFGIREPLGKQESLFCAENFPGKKICALVPGVAFGMQGQRLGHGMGFYDIYLSRLKSECKKNNIALFIAGLCFDFQVCKDVPLEKKDVLMDCVFSDRAVYSCLKTFF